MPMAMTMAIIIPVMGYCDGDDDDELQQVVLKSKQCCKTSSDFWFAR